MGIRNEVEFDEAKARLDQLSVAGQGFPRFSVEYRMLYSQIVAWVALYHAEEGGET